MYSERVFTAYFGKVDRLFCLLLLNVHCFSRPRCCALESIFFRSFVCLFLIVNVKSYSNLLSNRVLPVLHSRMALRANGSSLTDYCFILTIQNCLKMPIWINVNIFIWFYFVCMELDIVSLKIFIIITNTVCVCVIKCLLVYPLCMKHTQTRFGIVFGIDLVLWMTV